MSMKYWGIVIARSTGVAGSIKRIRYELRGKARRGRATRGVYGLFARTRPGPLVETTGSALEPFSVVCEFAREASFHGLVLSFVIIP